MSLILCLAFCPGPPQGPTSQVQVPVPSPIGGDTERPSPYDFGPAEQLLQSELPNLLGRAAVIVRQGGRELFRFQAGSIDYGTKTRIASMTKTMGAAVTLDLVETGHLTLDERIGDALPLFDARGLGDPTVLDCWSMRHGLETPSPYHHNSLLTHGQSILQIGTQGYEVFRPGTMLGYNGVAMQVAGYIAVNRTGLPWELLAEQRLFAPLGMDQSDYAQFAPNPAVGGGMRTSADDTMRFLQMVMDGGRFGGAQVLEPSSVDQLFVNHTSGLPVYGTPFPASHPGYPYGVSPDYGFGGWVLAANPVTAHVEEIVGAGAWGSFLWLDRRRDLTAVLITDVPAGSQRSIDAALGLMTVARAAVEAEQVGGLTGAPFGNRVRLTWSAPPQGTAARIFGSDEPIRDVFDLRQATFIRRTRAASAVVPAFAHYAVIAELGDHLNTAIVPGENVAERP